MEYYPLLFVPVYKDYIWGGQRIPRTYGRNVPAGICAESWEISARPEGMGVVSNGALAGQSLAQLADRMGSALFGASHGVSFPLLIKLIDARERLSLQVHPSDETASLVGGEPKTEMWYVLAAEAGAKVFAGLRPGTTAAALQEGLRAGRAEELLVAIPVRKGDAVFVPGGRVHAIDAGCLLLEVQQSSDTTYRLWDWGRVARDGKPRPLHMAQALASIVWSDASPALCRPAMVMHKAGNEVWDILRCPQFSVQRIDLAGDMAVRHDGGSFHALFVESGACAVRCAGGCEELRTGTSCLVPASVLEYTLRPLAGSSRVIRTTLGDAAGSRLSAS